MALASFTPVAPAGNGGNNTLYAATLGASANSALITPGRDAIIRIVGTQNMTVRFGTSTNITNTSATATDILLPANVPYVVDMGHYNDSINLFSLAASNVVTVNIVSKN